MRKKKESGKIEEDTTIAEDLEFKEEERKKAKKGNHKVHKKTTEDREEGKRVKENQKENSKETSLNIDILVKYDRGRNRKKKWKVPIPTRDKIKFNENYKKYVDKNLKNIERIQDNEWKKRLEYQIPVLEKIRRENNDASKKTEQKLGKTSETAEKYEKEGRDDK